MTEHRSRAGAGLIPLNPAAERLLSKITNLKEMLDEFRAQKLDDEHKNIVNICEAYIAKAQLYIDHPLLSSKFPFFVSRHPHLVWKLLHRVDEYFVLLIKEEELCSVALDVKTAFDLNIKEEKIRTVWIGANGKLIEVIDQLKKKQPSKEHRVLLFETP